MTIAERRKVEAEKASGGDESAENDEQSVEA